MMKVCVLVAYLFSPKHSETEGRWVSLLRPTQRVRPRCLGGRMTSPSLDETTTYERRAIAKTVRT